MEDKNKNKPKEPLDPHNTPEPPQIKDPNMRENERKLPGNSSENEKERPASDKKLGESPIEIDDETTI